jgi:hypothetical protein
MSEAIEQQIARLQQRSSELYQAGQFEQALPVAREVCSLVRQSVGERHPDFAQSLDNLAGLYLALGDHAAALPLARQVLEVRRAALGEQHPDFATSLSNLAALCHDMG